MPFIVDGGETITKVIVEPEPDNVISGSTDLEKDVFDPRYPFGVEIKTPSGIPLTTVMEVTPTFASPFLFATTYKEAIAVNSEELFAYEIAERLAEGDPELLAETYEGISGRELDKEEEKRIAWLKFRAKINIFFDIVKRWSIPIIIVSVIVIGLVGYQYSKAYVGAKAVKRASK